MVICGVLGAMWLLVSVAFSAGTSQTPYITAKKCVTALPVGAYRTCPVPDTQGCAFGSALGWRRSAGWAEDIHIVRPATDMHPCSRGRLIVAHRPLNSMGFVADMTVRY